MHIQTSEIRMLLEEHLASMRLHSLSESVYALPLDGLRQPEVAFWTVGYRRNCSDAAH